MKEYVLFGLVLMAVFVSADVIEPGTHTVSNCSKIINTSEFGDYVFVNIVNNYSPEYTVSQITSPSQCVNDLFAFKNSDPKLDQVLSWSTSINAGPPRYALVGIIEPIFDSNFPSNLVPDVIVNSNISYVSDINPVESSVVEYEIVSISDKVYLKKVKETQTFNNGDPVKEIIFEDSNSKTVEPVVPVKEKGIVESILCFFFSFFGQKC
jgi:hypothetical protein